MPTIMIVDDTPGSREPIAKLLRLEGFETVCAANGREALDLLDEIDVDLILLDLMMPVMDGMTFLDRLRRDPIKRYTPVILVTAVDDRQTMQKARRLGIHSYLIKARFSIGQMLENVKDAVDQGTADQTATAQY
jgi:serine/threonine-protein kinase PpkA